MSFLSYGLLQSKLGNVTVKMRLFRVKGAMHRVTACGAWQIHKVKDRVKYGSGLVLLLDSQHCESGVGGDSALAQRYEQEPSLQET